MDPFDIVAPFLTLGMIVSEATLEKSCIICGRDCRGIARIRDKAGHYYCQPCYELAQRRREQVNAETAVDEQALPEGHIFPAREEDEDLSLADSSDFKAIPYGSVQHITHRELDRIRAEIREELVSLEDTTMTMAALGREEDAALRRAEAHAKLQRDAPPPRRRGLLRRLLVPEELTGQQLDQVWPMFVGATSMVFGLTMLVVSGVTLTANVIELFSGEDATLHWWRVGTCLPIAALAGWLVVLGRSVYFRELRGGRGLQWWGAGSLALLVGYLVAVIVLAEQFARVPHEISPGIELGFLEGPTFLPAVMTWFVLLAFWPTFITFWFSRSMVKRSMRGWR